MAENWLLRLYVLDSNQNILEYKDIDAGLNEYFKSKKISVWMNATEEYHIAVGIIDPITNEPSVSLVNNEKISEFIYKLK